MSEFGGIMRKSEVETKAKSYAQHPLEAPKHAYTEYGMWLPRKTQWKWEMFIYQSFSLKKKEFQHTFHLISDFQESIIVNVWSDIKTRGWAFR